MAHPIPFARPKRPTVPPAELGYWLYITPAQHRVLMLMLAATAAINGWELPPHIASEVKQIVASRRS